MANLTEYPVVFAIFERNNREVVRNSLKMVPLNELVGYTRNKKVFYNKQIKCLCIPTEIMYPNFAYFEGFRKNK